MASDLSRIPPAKRQQLAATLGLFAALFVAVGAVSATGPATTALHVFMVIALVVAIVLGLMAWGVVHSLRVERAEADLDAAIEDVVAAAPRGQLCDCGHEHDPTELHVVDEDVVEPGAAQLTDACAHDGSGTACAHSCETCVLSALRTAAPRPSPRPRPAPQSGAGVSSRP